MVCEQRGQVLDAALIELAGPVPVLEALDPYFLQFVNSLALPLTLEVLKSLIKLCNMHLLKQHACRYHLNILINIIRNAFLIKTFQPTRPRLRTAHHHRKLIVSHYEKIRLNNY